MVQWRRRITWPAAICIGAFAAWAWESDAAELLLPAVAWLSLALTAVAAIHYRTSKDPDVMLMATAGAVLTMQSVFAQIQIRAWDGSLATFPSGVVTAALVGWGVAGGCLLLASPWWDRRGHHAASPGLGAGILAVVLGSDMLLLAFPPSTVVASGFVPWDLAPIPTIGWVWLWFGVAAWMLVAIRRILLIPRGNQHGAVAAAALAAVAGLVSWAVLARSANRLTEPAIGLYVWMQPASVALLVVALSLMQRADARQMRRSSDRADQILEGRAEIAGMIAHEVRGPVTTIRGIAATASAHYDGLSDEERRDFFGLIEQESRRLLGTVDQTSLALKIDAGSLTFQKAPAPLATIVRAGVDAAAIPADLRAVHVVAQEDVSLLADASRIAELVRQVVDNAAKYSPVGTPITVRAVADGDTALIEVTDEGPGIPPEQREAVFQRFTRWRPHGYEEQPGNGLGLFICRALVAEHQGEMSVENGPGGGTMLRVRLPLEGA
jgi:signal transduction histidine kinase